MAILPKSGYIQSCYSNLDINTVSGKTIEMNLIFPLSLGVLSTIQNEHKKMKRKKEKKKYMSDIYEFLVLILKWYLDCLVF